METQKDRGQEEYLINELANLAGVTVRTIRYYTDEGLLPPPDTRGKYAYYNLSHLLRLELIRRMKEAYLPLREIRQAIQAMSDDEVQQQVQVTEKKSIQAPPLHRVSEAKSDALDYIARVRSRQADLRLPDKNNEIVLPGQPQADKAPPKMGKIIVLDNDLPGESWRRIEIAPGIELNLREPVEPGLETIIEDIIKDIKQKIRKSRRGG
jgi:DNA-binding transcriptional MerR regulator